MDSFDRVVRNMMSRYGGTATLIVPQDGTYDVNSSEYVTPDPVQYSVKVLVFDYTLQSNGTQTMKNTLIETGDQQVIIQPLNKVDSALSMPRPRPEKDTIDIGGVIYNIVTCKETNPSLNDVVFYELYVRK
jgi:hypothetical protein